MFADAWATALNALGPNKGIKVANEHNISVMYIMQENSMMIKSNYWNYND
jgi:thiamine biosynthesis lipoprotein ApbE